MRKIHQERLTSVFHYVLRITFYASRTRPPKRFRRRRITHHASRITLASLLFAGSAALGAELDPSKLPPPAQVTVDFEKDVKPIFEKSCFRCHGPERPKSRFRLDNRESALKGGDNGVDIVPGNSVKSPLVYYVARVAEDIEMPRSEEHTSELQSHVNLVCRLLLEKKKK